MRPPFTVAILPETKNRFEKRAPLTPADVAWLTRRKIAVELCSSPLRIYPDSDYRKAGAKITGAPQKAKLLVGIKEPPVNTLIPQSVYLVFSHTTKKQPANRRLLSECLRKKITLIDYEHITDREAARLVYFGRFAGICGMIDCLHYLGRRYAEKGLRTPFERIGASLDVPSYDDAKEAIKSAAREWRRHGVPSPIAPFVIGITGHGNVSQGVEEVLELFSPLEIHPRDLAKFIQKKTGDPRRLYKTVFNREEKFRAKDGEGFYFEEYLKYPERFESNMDHFLGHLNCFMHCAYWDPRYPRLVTEKMYRKLYRQKNFRLALIGDLTCDVRGSVEITKKATDPGRPVFLYNPLTGKIRDGWKGAGTPIFAVDNLPCEFPRESSEEFSGLIRDYVLQLASHGVLDVTEHHILPGEIRRAVVTQSGKLSPPFGYLKGFAVR